MKTLTPVLMLISDSFQILPLPLSLFALQLSKPQEGPHTLSLGTSRIVKLCKYWPEVTLILAPPSYPNKNQSHISLLSLSHSRGAVVLSCSHVGRK